MGLGPTSLRDRPSICICIIQILDRVYLKYPHIKIEEPLYDFDVDYLQKILLRIGIDLNKLERKPLPLIRLIETNFDSNLLHIEQFAVRYGLLFLVTFGLILTSSVIFLQLKQ